MFAVKLSEYALQEFSKHDEQPSKYIKTYTGHNPKAGQDFSCDVAYERFLGPELFFQPEIYSSDYTVPLPQVCIAPLPQLCIATGAAHAHYTVAIAMHGITILVHCIFNPKVHCTFATAVHCPTTTVFTSQVCI